MRTAIPVEVTEDQLVELTRIWKSRTTPHAVVKRVRAVMLAAEGLENQLIADELSMGINGVARWRKRFAQLGIDGLTKDLPRSGRPRTITGAKRQALVTKVTQEKPPGRTHWSRATLATAVGVSESTVGRILRRSGLKPHLERTFKVSNDKHFEEKLTDVVGLYLSPPANAVVFSVDEKSQIQALDRTQPGLPIKRGRKGTMTHDYKRHGTTTLFAALNVLSGAVIGDCVPRHTHREWLQFLKKLDRLTPKGVELHVICDNYATHKHQRVRDWLERNPRVHVHFTPTSASWLNMVERFFRDITVNAIRRGVFTSVSDLIDAIDVYLIEHNRAPKPFIWTKSASDILAKVVRARAALEEQVRRLQQTDADITTT
jgi:transposase